MGEAVLWGDGAAVTDFHQVYQIVELISDAIGELTQAARMSGKRVSKT